LLKKITLPWVANYNESWELGMSITDRCTTVHLQLSSNELIAMALARNEGIIGNNGALRVSTGKRTARSPHDRFIVRDPGTESTVDWGDINQAISPNAFERLWKKAVTHIQQREAFVSQLQVGACAQHHQQVQVISERAWHNLFAHNLFIENLSQAFDESKAWTLLSVPNFKTLPHQDEVNSDAALILNFEKRYVLLCGLRYAGEIKKAMFSVMNYLMPTREVLSMHCAANQGHDHTTALFFGLSGTGKTTLSADPERLLIGDDEHGWSSEGIFNFEGGCYAKCIKLNPEKEPIIYQAIRHGAIMENVVMDPSTRQPDYDNEQLTENTRAAYPLSHIRERANPGVCPHPSAVIFLCCDLYGVLPPVAMLSQHQAAYYFLSGYTALIGSTEVDSADRIKPTFSACFGAPFFPRPPKVYAQLLMKRLEETKATVYLVNTGWTKGAYEQGGERFSIADTRQIVHSILNGQVQKAEKALLPGFSFAIPKQLEKLSHISLDPAASWHCHQDYINTANTLIDKFQQNFKRFDADPAIQQAEPQRIQHEP
jgi:phosphoenolpyruvate carboxykinase (ATP)